MPAADSRSEYDTRMHRVLAHIDAHLDQPLDLATLAGVAHFSPFHFHRLFAAWMGETLGDYLRRRRVEMAAMRLAAQPRVPVLHIALAVGFGSAEAFARAFRARFGVSPSAWRKQQALLRAANGNPGQVMRKMDQVATGVAPDHGASHKQEIPMHITVIDRPAVTVAYMRHTGPYGEPIFRFWQDVVAPWMVTDGLLGRARYGISHDDLGVTAPEQCRYDACIEVAPDFVPSAATAQLTTLPGGRYAVLHFSGTAAQMVDGWTALLRDWLPGSGLQLDARPCFEHYPVEAGYDPATGVFDCNICIPVTPL